MNITSIDRQTIREIRGIFEDALSKIPENILSNVSITVGNASFTKNNVTFKLEVAVKNADGQAVSKEAEDFVLYASRYGMSPEHLGQTFDTPHGRVKLLGCRPRSTKHPLVVEMGNGKQYKMAPSMLGFKNPISFRRPHWID